MAAPHPEKELTRLEALLASSALPRVIVLQGPGAWFVQRALDAVRRAFEGSADFTDFDGQDKSLAVAEAGNFLVDLRTRSLFGGTKVVLLRHAERWLRVHQKALAETVERIASGNLLVIAVPKLDGRSALYKRIKALGAIFEFRVMYDKPFGDRGRPESAELVQWVQQRAALHGLRFDAATALFIVEVVGADPAVLDGELVRIAPLLGKKPASAEALRGVLSVHFSSSQFELVDAILDGDAKAAFRSHRALFREGMRDKDGKAIDRGAVFPLVTAWLGQQLGKLMQARLELDAGVARSVVVAQHAGYFKERFERQLARATTARLREVLLAVRRAERRLRRSAEEPELLLERLLCECLLPIRKQLLGDDVAGQQGGAW